MKDYNYPSRKHQRLKNYNYSQNGYYFVTLCTKGKAKIFSEIVGRGFPDAPRTALTEFGKCVHDTIDFLNNHSFRVSIDKFAIMPNHIHMMIVIQNEGNGGASGKPRPTDGVLPKFISSLKRYTNKICQTDLWQTSFYDHIIRDENDYLTHWQYIDNNPAKWAEDIYYIRLSEE